MGSQSRLGLLYRLVESLYDWSNVYFVARGQHILASLPSHTGGAILEVGCGDSLLWTKRLAARSRFVVAVDVDGRRASHAKDLARRPHSQLHNAAWVLGDANALPFRSGSFAAVTGIDVIEHVTDDQKGLTEILRVVADGGRAILTTMHEKRRHYLRPLLFTDHIREYTEESLDHLCQQAGATVMERFSFYRPLTMILRELQSILPELRVPLANLVLRLPFGVLARLGEVAAGPPGGIGVVVEPCQRDQNTLPSAEDS